MFFHCIGAVDAAFDHSSSSMSTQLYGEISVELCTNWVRSPLYEPVEVSLSGEIIFIKKIVNAGKQRETRNGNNL